MLQAEVKAAPGKSETHQPARTETVARSWSNLQCHNFYCWFQLWFPTEGRFVVSWRIWRLLWWWKAHLVKLTPTRIIVGPILLWFGWLMVLILMVLSSTVLCDHTQLEHSDLEVFWPSLPERCYHILHSKRTNWKSCHQKALLYVYTDQSSRKVCTKFLKSHPLVTNHQGKGQ